jgi:hypothetical protein
MIEAKLLRELQYHQKANLIPIPASIFVLMYDMLTLGLWMDFKSHQFVFMHVKNVPPCGSKHASNYKPSD